MDKMIGGTDRARGNQSAEVVGLDGRPASFNVARESGEAFDQMKAGIEALRVQFEAALTDNAALAARVEKVTAERDQLATRVGFLERRVEQLVAFIDRFRGRVRKLFDAAKGEITIDHLTRLSNRRGFDDALGAGIARFRRFGEPVALFMLDIDHFKRINDTHGHSVGDVVLTRLAERLQSIVRETDTLARYGGEEIGLIASSKDMNPETMAVIGEKLRAAAADRPFVVNGVEIPVTLSVGGALFDSGMDTQAFIQAADAKLYQAKNSGRNRVEV